MTNDLTAASPGSLGIPTEAVIEFLNGIMEKRFYMHSLLILRHGKIAVEKYWPPFDANRKHRMYSISKSFTSLAVGMMIDEGKLSLESRVHEFFPEHMLQNPHKHILEATVRDLLMMATFNESTSYDSDSADFTKSFFTDSGPKHKPGQFFKYDTAATTVLCSIIEKLSGKTMLEYMRPVLDKIGFSKDAYCVQTPEGSSWTGSGILCTPRDLARIALLCMNGGKWNGEQLISRTYVEEATSRQIDTSVSEYGIESSYGYGYQFWRLRGRGFAMYGMGSQYALCLPDLDTVLITTADTQGTGSAGDILIDMFFRLTDKFTDKPLSEGSSNLNEVLDKLDVPRPLGKASSPVADKISGKKYMLDDNEAKIKWLRLVREEDKYKLQYENASGTHELIFGTEKYENQLFPEKYFGRRIGFKDANYKCIAACAWADENTFLGTLYAVDDYLGSIKIQLTFTENEVCGCMNKVAEWFFDEYQGFLNGKCVD